MRHGGCGVSAGAMGAVHGGMRDLAAGGLAAENNPFTVAALERVVHLHGGAFLLGAEEDLGLRMVAVHRDFLELGVHGGEIETAGFLQMLEDGGANGLLVRTGFATGGTEEKKGCGEQPNSSFCHANDFSSVTVEELFTIPMTALFRS